MMRHPSFAPLLAAVPRRVASVAGAFALPLVAVFVLLGGGLGCSNAPSPQEGNETTELPDASELAWLEKDGPPAGTNNGAAEYLLEEIDEYASLEELVELADLAFFQRDFATARVLYDRARNLGLDEPGGLTRLGICVMERDPAGAIPYFEAALEQDLAQWEAQFYLATCHFRIGRVADRTIMRYHNNRFVEHVQRGALTHFQRLLELKREHNLPIYPAALFNRGLSLYIATDSGLVARQDFIHYYELVGPDGPYAAKALRWIHYFEEDLALESSKRYTPNHSVATSQ